ncbi:VPLPA-CTERM-specific exosortase XrtD [Pararhodobacter sp. SW119]|uniref:VPLPA-CTERM-specific exosortase XrtD n=1 Tax=Pararhodobacter sp. SW119 TaxID=2780075 RepID=UPI001AE0D328|nr:VPLPA-CTERM-specific exosortase XrtD [Pararhodobacter sp. SW119]
MSASPDISLRPSGLRSFLNWGVFWLVVAVTGSVVFFWEGIAELLAAWRTPEYSHGPLIPVLSALLFLRQLKTVPIETGTTLNRWPGLALLVFSLALAFAGKMIGIGDIVAYGLILWWGAVLLISFGWQTGKHFWPPIVHLVYMLPLPGALYFGMSTFLQGISSEMGVALLHLLRVPVYLEGNIIDLGDFKLHVAEACSGLRYLFPILSFSYVFAVLYQGPMWHKALLLVAAAPITVILNSVRIAIAGVIVQHWGVDWVEGFTHFFEGWVIFLSAVALLVLLSWILLQLRRPRVGVLQALDLDTTGLGTQAMRLRLIEPSRTLIFGALLGLVLGLVWQAIPEREPVVVTRDPFGAFPHQLGGWQATPLPPLDPQVAQILAADDYHSAILRNPRADAPVELFMAWYSDQMRGGVHSPEVCLPGGGWEIARLERIDVSEEFGNGATFTLNRAVIQRGMERSLVYYWYEQQGQRTASEFTAKMQLMSGKLRNGRQDSAIVRLITPIGVEEPQQVAEQRLRDALGEVLEPLPRFVPGLRN